MAVVLAEIQVVPSKLGAHTAEIHTMVDAAISAIKSTGVHYEVGALGTTLEGEYEVVVHALLAAHRAVLDAGADTVQSNIRLIERRDTNLAIAETLQKYR